MIPWEKLASARVPGGDEELRLMRRGAEFSIMLGRAELMNSRLSASEEALASLAIERLKPSGRRRVLVGGLGMGFTLRAALAALGPKDQVVVAEISADIIAWAKGPMASLLQGALEDPRVSLHLGDVGRLMRDTPGAYDAILMDVDNGPDGIVRPENDLLYGGSGIASAMRAVAPGGVLAIWSAGPDVAFVKRLSRLGLKVEEKKVAASRSGKGPRHVIWLARAVETTSPMGRGRAAGAGEGLRPSRKS